MGKKRKRLTLIPSYRRDAADPSRAVAVWRDLTGKKRRRSLPGDFDSPESRTALDNLRAEVKASATGRPIKAPTLTVAAMLDAFLKHARSYYRGHDGRPTSQLSLCNSVARSVCGLFAHKPAAEFGPLCLKACLDHWVKARLCRTGCNKRLGITKGMFKWAASEQLIKTETYLALTTVAGLRRGRTSAAETDPVTPVEAETVNATVPYLNRQILGLVELQWLTGCRPGEACAIRWSDIDTSGDVWLYRPVHHKTAHKGRSRVVALGPKAQELLKRFSNADSAYLFSPRRAMIEVQAKRRQARQTKLYPSHLERNKLKKKRRPERRPGERYSPTEYARAIARACDQAFPPPVPLRQERGETLAKWKARLTVEQKAELKKWRDAHRWHPNQLRHSFATAVRNKYGLEEAQVALGHARADVTQIYAERDMTLASSVAAEIG